MAVATPVEALVADSEVAAGMAASAHAAADRARALAARRRQPVLIFCPVRRFPRPAVLPACPWQVE